MKVTQLFDPIATASTTPLAPVVATGTSTFGNTNDFALTAPAAGAKYNCYKLCLIAQDTELAEAYIERHGSRLYYYMASDAGAAAAAVLPIATGTDITVTRATAGVAGDMVDGLQVRDAGYPGADMSAAIDPNTGVLWVTLGTTATGVQPYVTLTESRAGAGLATVTVTGALVVGSPLAIDFAVAAGDTASQVATKCRTALNVAAITDFYTIGGADALVTLTSKAGGALDPTLNLALTNKTCFGLTPVSASANSAAGTLGQAQVERITCEGNCTGTGLVNFVVASGFHASTPGSFTATDGESPEQWIVAFKAAMDALSDITDHYTTEIVLGTQLRLTAKVNAATDAVLNISLTKDTAVGPTDVVNSDDLVPGIAPILQVDTLTVLGTISSDVAGVMVLTAEDMWTAEGFLSATDWHIAGVDIVVPPTALAPLAFAWNATTHVLSISLPTNVNKDVLPITDTALAAAFNLWKVGEGIPLLATTAGVGVFQSEADVVLFADGVNHTRDAAKNTATLVAAALDGLDECSAAITGGVANGAAVLNALPHVDFTGGGVGIAITSTTTTMKAGVNASPLAADMFTVDDTDPDGVLEEGEIQLESGVSGIILKAGQAVFDGDYVYLAIADTTEASSANLRKIALADFIES